MITLKHQLTCPHCSHIQTVDCSDFAEAQPPHDRGMGDEIEYSVDCPDYPCSNCHKEFYITGSFWEYPIGILNQCTVKASIHKGFFE